MSAVTWIGVAVLGGAAALLRFLLDALISTNLAPGFPVGTLVVNMSGAFLLGLVTGLEFSGDALVLTGTAALGSYTTFSTWMLETHRLREEGEFSRAMANAVISVAVGLGAVALGRTLGMHL